MIDLRNNPGGNLDVVCNMLKLLLPEGTIVSTKDKNGKTDKITCDGTNDLKAAGSSCESIQCKCIGDLQRCDPGLWHRKDCWSNDLWKRSCAAITGSGGTERALK